MGRSKFTLKRIENPTSRQVIFFKRKEGIVKKAGELSVLCDTDVGLIMFSPSGMLTCFASSGSIEDIFLRFISRPDELKGGPIWNEEYLCQRLKQVKTEGEIMEKMAKIEMLEDMLFKLNRKQREANEKMRYYDPNEDNITSLFEAGVYQQFLENAIQRIENSKVKLLHTQIVQEKNGDHVDVHEVVSADSNTDELGNSNLQSKMVWSNIEHEREESRPMGHHLNIDFLKAQTNWNLAGRGQASTSNITRPSI
ncbi:agamous-like MADS-box protein AGL66 [Impatiens glandulifera]|uniref:agamous-like MADS-box protein AGL66 n=1 Tax=Impatiens glandulifera TaxID=253017 RepID=UPI001FB126BE|nr:agamous-like MADS-box protein AGL66 [Impatiens glandulifera]